MIIYVIRDKDVIDKIAHDRSIRVLTLQVDEDIEMARYVTDSDKEFVDVPYERYMELKEIIENRPM